MRNYVLFAIILSILSLEMSAQQTPISPYSFFGIGDIFPLGSGYHLMKGGTGIADRNALVINTLNPASYSSIDFPATFINEFAVSLSAVNWNDHGENELQWDMGFPYASFAVKALPKGGLAFGLRAFSNVNYHIQGEERFNGLPGTYHVDYSGSGGLNEVFLGYGYQLSPRFSLGAQMSYIFGTITYDQEVDNQEFNYNIRIEDKQFSNGIRLSVGAQYVIPMGESSLSLGVTYDPQTSLNNTRELIISDLLGSSSAGPDTVTANEVDIHQDILPHAFGAGASWNYRGIFAISADVRTQLWSNASFESTAYEVRDSRRMSLGFEKLPKARPNKYVDYVSWSMGLFNDQSYLLLNEEGLDTYGITAGINLPTKGNLGVVRLIAEYGMRGHNISNSFSESYVKLTL